MWSVCVYFSANHSSGYRIICEILNNNSHSHRSKLLEIIPERFLSAERQPMSVVLKSSYLSQPMRFLPATYAYPMKSFVLLLKKSIIVLVKEPSVRQ